MLPAFRDWKGEAESAQETKEASCISQGSPEKWHQQDVYIEREREREKEKDSL